MPKVKRLIVRQKLYIGASGFFYSHWENNVFYPQGLPKTKQLEYYAEHFSTVELNNPFYRLPEAKTFSNWVSRVPPGFIFAVKASRFITHIKRLQGIEQAWKTFIENALNLEKKLGPILFQFPPNFKATEENIKRLEEFLKFITKYRVQYTKYKIRFALEFRHETWCDRKIYKLFKKYNVAWVIADSPRYPKSEEVTANFVYIRMHGSKAIFSSNYTKKELRSLSQKIRKWRKSYDVYVYFNNDAYGYAIENAKALRCLCLPC